MSTLTEARPARAYTITYYTADGSMARAVSILGTIADAARHALTWHAATGGHAHVRSVTR